MDSERDDVRRFFRWNRAAWARFSRLCSKELREVLRDRRTILTLVLMPILAYPLLGVAFRKLLVAQLRDVNQIEYHIGFSSEVDAQVFAALVSRGSELVGPDLKNGRPVIL